MKFKDISKIGKAAIYLSGIMVVSFVIAFGVFFTPGILQAEGRQERSGGGGEKSVVDQRETASMDGIEKVVIETSSPDVLIQPGTATAFQAHLQGTVLFRGLSRDPQPVLKKRLQGSTLIFKVEMLNDISIGISSINLQLTVTVPKEYEQVVVVDTSSGTIEASGLTLDQFEGESSSGEIVVQKVLVDSLRLSASSGDIDVESLRGRDAVIKTSSGDIDLDQIEAESMTVDSSSGSLRGNRIETISFSRDVSSGETKIDGFSGRLRCNSTSGDLRVTYVEFGDHVEIDSSSGEVVLEIPGSPAFEVDIETSSGDIDCDWPVTMTVNGVMKDNRLKGTVGGDGGPSVIIRTTSGDVELIQG